MAASSGGVNDLNQLTGSIGQLISTLKELNVAQLSLAAASTSLESKTSDNTGKLVTSETSLIREIRNLTRALLLVNTAGQAGILRALGKGSLSRELVGQVNTYLRSLDETGPVAEKAGVKISGLAKKLGIIAGGVGAVAGLAGTYDPNSATQFRYAIRDTAASLGQGLNPLLKEFIVITRTVGDLFVRWEPTVEAVSKTFVLVLDGARPLITAFGALAPVVNGVATGLGVLLAELSKAKIGGQEVNLVGAGASAFLAKKFGFGPWGMAGAAVLGSGVLDGVKGGKTIGGGIQGGLAGAAIGSFIPGIGTGIGAAVGAIIGGIGANLGDEGGSSVGKAPREPVRMSGADYGMKVREAAFGATSAMDQVAENTKASADALKVIAGFVQGTMQSVHNGLIGQWAREGNQ